MHEGLGEAGRNTKLCSLIARRIQYLFFAGEVPCRLTTAQLDGANLIDHRLSLGHQVENLPIEIGQSGSEFVKIHSQGLYRVPPACASDGIVETPLYLLPNDLAPTI